MALTKAEKETVVNEVTELLTNSKMTVVATYQGIDVKAMQQLRRKAKENGTKVKVIKNRLVSRALKDNKTFADIDTSSFNGMLLYAFNDQDEVAAAQVLQDFAKSQSSLSFVGAISAEGKLVDAATVSALAALPGKNQMLAGLINTLSGPLQSAIGSLQGNLHGLLQGLEAKAKAA